MSIKIRPATETDIDEIVLLVNSAYRGPTSTLGWTTEAEFLDGQRTDSASLKDDLKKGTVLCLFENAHLQGCVYLEILNPELSPTCYLGMLTINPKEQSRGLGKILYDAAEVWARHQGAKRMEMSVVQVRDSLLAWYKRLGFQANGRTRPFPYGDESFGIPKRDDLYFLVLEKPL